jgi:uncharacterized damage-inducible protein DinB
MSLREFLVSRRKAEYKAFSSVMRALPADKYDYKPHDRSPSAKQLVWTLTAEQAACIEIATKGRTEWREVPIPAADAMVAQFEREYPKLTDIIAGMDDETWVRKGQLVMGEQTWEQPVGEFLWFILFDAIHHRGQLSAYIRPMGGKVPAIYGPSADDPGR